MKKVSFMKDGMEIHSSYVEGEHKMGDPLPVALVRSALKDWKTQMGWNDNNFIAAKSAWDQVRINAQTFSAEQFLLAEKRAPAQDMTSGGASSPQKALRTRAPGEQTILQAPARIPDDWCLLDDNHLSSQNAFERARLDQVQTSQPVINQRGEIEFDATNEALLRADLQKIGAKFRPPKIKD